MPVRDYRESDEEALRACVIQLQDAERNFFPKTADGHRVAKPYIDYLLTICRANRGRVLVAEHSGQVVGYSAYQIWDNAEEVHEEAYEFGYISDLVVLDTHRAKGFGRALLDAAQSGVKAEGIELVRIGVLAGNESVRRLYANCGFDEHKIVLEKKL